MNSVKNPTMLILYGGGDYAIIKIVYLKKRLLEKDISQYLTPSSSWATLATFCSAFFFLFAQFELRSTALFANIFD